jgi:hypothetical protein
LRSANTSCCGWFLPSRLTQAITVSGMGILSQDCRLIFKPLWRLMK